MSVELLIVDDSAVARQALSALFPPGEFQVDTALDAVFALGKMQKRWPDVVVLDLEMPRLDGLEFLRRVMAERPTPVVVCSGLSERGTRASMEALAAGALAVVSKASLRAGSEGGQELVRLVREAAGAAGARRAAPAKAGPGPEVAPPAGMPRPADVVAVGASTGGPQSLEEVLVTLTPEAPPVVVVQHMPEKFTRAFAARLDEQCRVEVREAQGGELLRPGLVLVAPGARHLQVKRVGNQLLAEVLEGPPVNRHCPSVDVLFRSLARLGGTRVTAVLMTGMGDDGARGLLELRRAGAATYAQDEATSIVFGMPREAIRLGAAEQVLALAQIGPVIQGSRLEGALRAG